MKITGTHSKGVEVTLDINDDALEDTKLAREGKYFQQQVYEIDKWLGMTLITMVLLVFITILIAKSLGLLMIGFCAVVFELLVAIGFVVSLLMDSEWADLKDELTGIDKLTKLDKVNCLYRYKTEDNKDYIIIGIPGWLFYPVEARVGEFFDNRTIHMMERAEPSQIGVAYLTQKTLDSLEEWQGSNGKHPKDLNDIYRFHGWDAMED
jgi:hypothetical protein